MPPRWRCKGAEGILSSVEQGVHEWSQTGAIDGSGGSAGQGCMRLVGVLNADAWNLASLHSRCDPSGSSLLSRRAFFRAPFNLFSKELEAQRTWGLIKSDILALKLIALHKEVGF